MSYYFQCGNPDCVIEGGRPFIFEAAKPLCTKCGQGPPITGTVTIMHYAYYDTKGIIKGYMGRKISIACVPGQNITVSPFIASTSYIPLVNCPRCKTTEIYKRMWVPRDYEDVNAYMDNPNTTDSASQNPSQEGPVTQFKLELPNDLLKMRRNATKEAANEVSGNCCD